ncbi:MFS transporter [Georgenia sp. MJ170]|uniref:MFS transporter n=1 Tax=Georgenia sunbinii TaxID=3117728 RepID=UPI002F26D211
MFPARAVLRQHNYRLFVSSQVFANTGVWMQRIAQDWLVLSLSGSVTAVGITSTLQFAPVVLFGMFGGVLADRYSKRMLLIITQGAAAVLATVLAVLTFTGTIQVGHVYIIALVLGLVTAVDSPARQVFVPELVGREHLRAAVSINSSVFQLGGLVGPAVGGLVIATFGEGWAFAANAVGCVVVVSMLIRVRPGLLHRLPTSPRAPGQLRVGLRYVRASPPILWSIVVVGTVGILSLNLPVILAAFADRVYNSGAGGFGTFNAMIAVGGVLGAITATRQQTNRMRNLVTMAGVLGLVLALAALAPSATTFSVALVLVGMATLRVLIAAHLLVQLGTDLALQGRVMGIYLLVQLGGRAVGGPVVGVASEALGARASLLICGLAMVGVTVLVGIVLARLGSLRLSLRRPRAIDLRLFTITPQVPVEQADAARPGDAVSPADAVRPAVADHHSPSA